MMVEAPSSALRKVAFFDFDGTLAERDSLWPFLVAVAGLPRCLLAGVKAVISAYCFSSRPDKRTAIKEILLSSVLAGRKVSDLSPAIARMAQWPRWIAPSVEALKKHHAQGHSVVIATGSLDLYVHTMLGDLPVYAVICTRMEVQNGVLTGRMQEGNCVRARKAELVAAYMRINGPFDESWAYGNLPHDLPMMELTTHRVVV